MGRWGRHGAGTTGAAGWRDGSSFYFFLTGNLGAAGEAAFLRVPSTTTCSIWFPPHPAHLGFTDAGKVCSGEIRGRYDTGARIIAPLCGSVQSRDPDCRRQGRAPPSGGWLERPSRARPVMPVKSWVRAGRTCASVPNNYDGGCAGSYDDRGEDWICTLSYLFLYFWQLGL